MLEALDSHPSSRPVNMGFLQFLTGKPSKKAARSEKRLSRMSTDDSESSRHLPPGLRSRIESIFRSLNEKLSTWSGRKNKSSLVETDSEADLERQSEAGMQGGQIFNRIENTAENDGSNLPATKVEMSGSQPVLQSATIQAPLGSESIADTSHKTGPDVEV